MPDAMLPARPSARVVVSASMPRSRQAATVAPKTPQTPVGWKPRRWNPSGAAMPMRVTVSVAATIAARVCAPGRADGLGDGDRRGHDDRRHMGDRCLVGVVEVEAVAEHAVGQRGGGRGNAVRAADRAGGTRPRVLGHREPWERLSDAQRGEPTAQRVEDVVARDRAYLRGHVGEVQGRRPGRELLRRGPLLGLDRHVLMMPRPAMCLTYARW